MKSTATIDVFILAWYDILIIVIYWKFMNVPFITP